MDLVKAKDDVDKILNSDMDTIQIAEWIHGKQINGQEVIIILATLVECIRELKKISKNN